MLRRCHQPRVFGIYLIAVFELAVANDLVEELVREEAGAAGLGRAPAGEYNLLNFADGDILGDACVGHPIHAARVQGELILGAEAAVMGQALVGVVGHQVEEVLLEVGAGHA